LFKRKRTTEPVDPDDRSPETGVKYKDLAVVAKLVDAGADMSQPRHVVHYVYFDNRDDATTAVAEARRSAFEVVVREPQPPSQPQWALVCERHGVILDAPTIRHSRDFFESLASRCRGDYDGWEASVR
jgi:regulator of RNase E activity RraB